MDTKNREHRDVKPPLSIAEIVERDNVAAAEKPPPATVVRLSTRIVTLSATGPKLGGS